MAQKKYVIILPIISSLLLLASVSGIISNAFALSETSNSFSRSFSVSNLTPDEVVANSIPMPDQVNDPEVRFSISYLDELDENQAISIFLFEEDPGFSRLNRSEFENSSIYATDLITSALEVKSSQTLYPGSNIDFLYIVIGNDADVELSFTVFMTITEVDFQSVVQTARVLGVIFSAILTAFFFFGSLYLWMEYIEKIEVRILTEELEEKLDQIQDRALSWELLGAGLVVAFFIVGYSQLLVGADFGFLIFAAIGSGVIYYNYTNRQEIENSIRGVLLSHGEISLSELAEMIVQDEATTKKALLDAIMYSNLPASFDFKTEMVKYDPSKDRQASASVVEPVSESNFQVASTEVQSRQINEEEDGPARPMPKCAYCDTEAISRTAQFCHSCGASMSSAK